LGRENGLPESEEKKRVTPQGSTGRKKRGGGRIPYLKQRRKRGGLTQTNGRKIEREPKGKKRLGGTKEKLRGKKKLKRNTPRHYQMM